MQKKSTAASSRKKIGNLLFFMTITTIDKNLHCINIRVFTSSVNYHIYFFNCNLSILLSNRMVCEMSKIRINLENVLKEKGISKTQLCYACRLQRTQLNNYCKNKVVRIDLNTIARMCDFIDCRIEDILVLEEEKPEESETE